MVLLSDGSDDEAAAAAQAVAQQERRLARQQRAKARAQATCQLFEEFDQFTQKRWATVKLLAEHGFVEQSQRLAADVQILQDCCDANRALIGEQQGSRGSMWVLMRDVVGMMNSCDSVLQRCW